MTSGRRGVAGSKPEAAAFDILILFGVGNLRITINFLMCADATKRSNATVNRHRNLMAMISCHVNGVNRMIAVISQSLKTQLSRRWILAQQPQRLIHLILQFWRQFLVLCLEPIRKTDCLNYKIAPTPLRHSMPFFMI